MLISNLPLGDSCDFTSFIIYNNRDRIRADSVVIIASISFIARIPARLKKLLVWVDVILACIVIAALLTATELTYALLAALGPITVPVTGILALTILSRLWAIVSTMRSLLMSAITDHTELAGVV
ncbi:hypothetical protein KEM60_02396 [Austwickia sp. TVS 96-490-7B]|nr:hypothetical protein [Austwickia sp. TVS 96-490-7B]